MSEPIAVVVVEEMCLHDEVKNDCVTCSGEGEVSVSDARLDTLVQRASVPNLATLFQRGKAAGLLKPGKDYA